MLGMVVGGSGTRAPALTVVGGWGTRAPALTMVGGSGTRAPALSMLISPAIHPIPSGSPNSRLKQSN